MKANKIVSILLIVVIITSFIVPQPNAFLKETNTCEHDHDIDHTQVYHAAKENLIERAVNWLFYPNIAYSLSCSHNIVGATCTQPVRCTKCGFSPGGSPLGHSFGSWTTVTTGNCKTYGSQKRTCSRCGTSETRSVSGSHNIVSATCTQPVRCTICGYSPGGTALGHSFGSWTTVTTGNCKTYGSEKRTCSKCGTSETRSVTGSHNIVGATCTQPVRCTICGYSPGGSALGHSFGSWTTVTAGNCKTYGTQKRTCSRCSTSETNSVLGSHNIVGATCTEPVRCTICGYSPGGGTLGHSFGSWTTVTTGNCKTYGTQKRTCSRCGTSETSSVLGSHNIVGATCTEPVRCTICGFSPGGTALGHSFGSWTTMTTGDCKTYGTEKRTCSRCGTSETNSVLGSHNIVSATCTEPVRCTICGFSPGGTALGHSFGSWTTVTTGNCTTYGKEKRTCSKCGASETSSVLGSHNIVGATCTEPVRCTICGFSPGGTALGHSFGSWTTVTTGNCKTYGTEKRTCSRCNSTENRSVTGSHDIVPATCTEPVRCTICGFSPGGTALGHSFGSWSTVTTGNCKTDGTEKRACSRCNATENRSVAGSHDIVPATCTEPVRCTICEFSIGAPIPHSVNKWTITKNATCITTGVQTGECVNCKITIVQDIPKSQHNYILGNWQLTSLESECRRRLGVCDICQDEKVEHDNDHTYNSEGKCIDCSYKGTGNDGTDGEAEELANQVFRVYFTENRGSSPAMAANTKVTPEVAIEVLKNLSKGELPWRPELSQNGGSAFFTTEGDPYTGIDPTKNFKVDVNVDIPQNALVFNESTLLEIYNRHKDACRIEAEQKFRNFNNIPENSSFTPKQLKAFDRFHHKFAERLMWNEVGATVRTSSVKVGEVILQNSFFSKQGDGKFAVVADASKVQVEGGITRLSELVKERGVVVEPALVEAAEAMATKLKWAGTVRNVFKYGGKVLIVVGVATDVYKVYVAEDKVKAVIESAGGWAGATAGAAAFAAWWTPADVAGPWAWAAHGVGTLVAGGIGYWVGSEATRTIYELVVEE